MSWPPQVAELSQLPDWPAIEQELAALPDRPAGNDFETFVVSMMGPTLYRLFVEGYTRKHWACEPSSLSSRLAPKRVELRRDGYRRLFRDRWEFFPPDGVNSAIEAMLAGVSLLSGAEVGVEDVAGQRPLAAVITAAVDQFLGRPDELAWRGIHMRSRYFPTGDPGETRTPAYVINRPSPGVPYTRTVETKHASGQRICGTVVSEEHPCDGLRHYPVPTVDCRHERHNRVLQEEVRDRLAPVPVFFCGRLATYRYIDQDQAIEQAFACADRVLATLRGG
jgi:UDP-galactopyranose mutase